MAHLSKEKGIIPEPTGALWFKTGWLPSAGPAEYDFGSGILTLTQLFGIMLVLMSAAEGLRLRDFLKPARVRLRGPNSSSVRGVHIQEIEMAQNIKLQFMNSASMNQLIVPVRVLKIYNI